MIRQKDSRHKKALKRLKDRETRDPRQQTARLDDMFGKGEGAIKERARLAKLIKNEPKKKPKKTSPA